MAQINVVVHGVLGNMGQETLRMATAADDMNPVGAADAAAAPGTLALPDGSGQIPLSNDLAAVLSGADPTPDVVVDFSRADGAVAALRTATAAGVNVVVGTTGLGESDYAEADALANEHGVGVMIAPNFAMGAVLMIHLAKRAARFFEYADLTETHHEAKIDAPSGTALAIAQAVVDGKGGGFASVPAEKELIAGPRGGVYEGVSVHSARMPGRRSPPRANLRRSGPDADHPARLHQPRKLHARRCDGGARRGESQGADSGAGEYHGVGVEPCSEWRKTMQTATSSEFKESPGQYLDQVKAGEEVLIVGDEGPIAVLKPAMDKPLDERLRELDEAGLIKMGTGKLPDDFWDLPRPADPEGTVLAALLEEREEGW